MCSIGQLPTSLHMITEEAVPLQVSLEDEGSGRSNYSISWGIHQILVSHHITQRDILSVISVCDFVVG